ncbi:hypothetical protein SAMN04488059_1063 [Devosia psychrophila]|uniref:Uncharacterized protein n=1 Tax=Devosia psychrophila TaxID=728005 RepID=A0A1I1JU82_9HYPH|nr:hypothetical protein SAMN04488059_1063 [Devosia psychrophila]
MTLQTEGASAGTNCGGPKLVAVQSYSRDRLSRLITFCNAAPRRAGFATHSRPRGASFCKSQEGDNVW